MRISWVAAAVGAALMMVPLTRARADVLIDTTGTASMGVDMIAPSNVVSGGGGPIADSFSVGTQGLQLSSVTLVLAATNATDGGAMVVSLWTNSPNGDANGNMPAPGELIANLATVNDSSLTASFSEVVIPVTQAIALAANGRFWIEVANKPSLPVTSGQWDYTFSSSAAAIPSAANEFNWGNYAGYLDTSFADNVNGVDMFVVSAVPEPMSIALLGLAVLALGLARSWSTKSV